MVWACVEETLRMIGRRMLKMTDRQEEKLKEEEEIKVPGVMEGNVEVKERWRRMIHCNNQSSRKENKKKKEQVQHFMLFPFLSRIYEKKNTRFICVC